MIARIAFLVFALIVLGGMYYLLLLAYRVLDLAEQLVDRQYGPALAPQAEEEDAPPEPERPRPTPHPRTDTTPAMAAITPEAVTGLIDDRELAHTYAAIENNFRNWRASLAERGSK